MKGKIARCSLGCLGIITNDEKQMVTYAKMQNDGSLSALAYVGVHLEDSEHAKAGDPWSSRNPNIIGDFNDLVSYWREAL